MLVKFWGVRGTHSCWGTHHSKIGGNTPCISIQASDTSPPVIFDAGSGIASCAKHFLSQDQSALNEVHICLTHQHLDHIQGFPFFKPLWNSEATLTVYEGQGTKNFQDLLTTSLMMPPLFPIPFKETPSQKNFEWIRGTRDICDLSVTPVPLNHIGATYGYVITHDKKKVAYLTDHEHYDAHVDLIKTLKYHCQNADLIIFDTMFSNTDIVKYRGWGHSSWGEACAFAKDVQAKRLALFHHNPDYDDTDLLNIEQDAQQRFSGAFLAREQATIDI